MKPTAVTIDAGSHTLKLVRWLEWFEEKHGFIPTRVILQRGMMQAVCWENGMPVNLSEYGLMGIPLGVKADG